MRKSFSIIIFCLVFLLIVYSNCLNLLKSGSKFLEFNQYDSKNEEGPLIVGQNEINIKIEDNQEKIKLGKKGALYFMTDYNDTEANIFDASDIEEKTKFETKIHDDIKSNIIYCRLWKPNNDYLRIICEVNNFDLNQNISLSDNVSLTYNKYTINIFLKGNLTIEKKDYEIPFLYSDIQFIDIKDDIEPYSLKFKMIIYNNELLHLYGEVNNSIILDKCEKNENELNCKITKEKLEEILVKIKNNLELKRLMIMKDQLNLIMF